MEFSIKLNKSEDAANVSRAANKYEADIDIKSKQYNNVVDAKSMMGIMSLDLSNEVTVSCKDKEVFYDFKEDLKEFVVE